LNLILRGNRYLKAATLSLYLFNLLPLPMLDGAQLLRTLLDYNLVLGSAEHGRENTVGDLDLESGFENARGEGRTRSMRTRPRARWKDMLQRGVEAGTSAACVGCVVLGVWTSTSIR
jgi:S2P endopeptidase